MRRGLFMALLGSGLWLIGSAQAQWGGYGGYGWGGWGGTTAMGSNARGMGVFAAGVGQYNVDTAQARSINADTTMRFNEYMWESQQIRNKQYYEQLARRRQTINASAEQEYTRLRSNPESRDIQSGDALNVVLDELTRPGVYTTATSAGSIKLSSASVKDIPFTYAPQAVTISLDELTDQPPPDLLMQDQFKANREAVRALADQARKEADEQGKISRETLAKVRERLNAIHQQLLSGVPDSKDRREAETYLKALYGLTKMLEEPEIDQFLRELDKVPETTLANLISFMNAFNLRFGVAGTPRQRSVYSEIYPQMVQLRDQVYPADATSPLASAPTPSSERARRAQETFSTIDMNALRGQPSEGNTPAPVPPPPGETKP